MNLLFRHFVTLCCVSILSVKLFAASSGCVLSEEGSRYHGTLDARVTFNGKVLDCNFWGEHAAMASVVQSDADEGQYSSLVRFSPIFINPNDELEVGPTVHITSPDLLSVPETQPSYEVGFASGEYNAKSQDPSMKFNTVYDLSLSDTISKRGLLTLRPALHKTKKDGCVTNKFPVRFMMGNYVDPGLLKQQLQYRYVKTDGSLITKGNIEAILTPHQETLRAIDESRRSARENLLRMAEAVQEEATNVVLETHRLELEATNSPNSNPKTNSYNCAEQCKFTYLKDHRVMDYLRKRLGVESQKFVGLIVNAHCSHTPCHSCMTSFTREIESGGVFNDIAKGKPVHVLCSCQWHYKRPKEMLPYDQTHFFDSLKEDVASLSLPYPAFMDKGFERTPYPVVLLESISGGAWRVATEHYKQIWHRQVK